MNPSDDEEINEAQNEQSVTQSSEEIEELLEPKAIPDERIVRHAEKNDSYREAPTTDDDEEIIQPPLETTENIEENEKVAEEATQQTEPEPAMEEVSDIISEIAPEIKEEIFQEPPVPQVEAMPEVVPQQEEIQIQPGLPATPPPGHVEYHTISGGPETINDTISEHSKVDRVGPPPVGMMYANSTSGYTIPDPHYVPPDPRGAEIPGNFGMVLFLGTVAIIGAGVTYVYFYMPEVFDEFFSALVIIKNEMFK